MAPWNGGDRRAASPEQGRPRARALEELREHHARVEVPLGQLAGRAGVLGVVLLDRIQRACKSLGRLGLDGVYRSRVDVRRFQRS